MIGRKRLPHLAEDPDEPRFKDVKLNIGNSPTVEQLHQAYACHQIEPFDQLFSMFRDITTIQLVSKNHYVFLTLVDSPGASSKLKRSAFEMSGGLTPKKPFL